MSLFEPPTVTLSPNLNSLIAPELIRIQMMHWEGERTIQIRGPQPCLHLRITKELEQSRCPGCNPEG